ncbi:MAG TPA: tetratricopeptide repeat protein, partial [Candidatus Baltobacteraceae bacterium]|nr:tetratricopeptide repeat protein [Candidatus Baltobacteraceae bacterium]
EYLERIGDEMGVVRALNGLAVAAIDLDLDASTAQSYIDAALPVARRATGGERLWLGILLGNRSEVERFEGGYRTAIASAREALRILNEQHEKARAGWQLTNIAHCQLLENDGAAAIKSLREAYGYLSEEPDPRMIGWYFDVWIIVAAGLGYWDIAIRILGFVATFRARNGLVRLPLLLPWTAPVVSRLSRKYSEDAYERLVTEGGELTLEAAEELTRSIVVTRSAVPASPVPTTTRQRGREPTTRRPSA